MLLTHSKIPIQLRVLEPLGGTGQMRQTEMAFDSGSQALQVSHRLIRDRSVFQRTVVRFPVGSMTTDQSKIQMDKRKGTPQLDPRHGDLRVSLVWHPRIS